MYRTGILFGLKQTRNNRGLEGSDRGCFRLQPNIGGVRQIVRLPPALLLPLASKIHHAPALRLVSNVVQLTQVTYVTERGNTVAGFHTAQLAHGEQESLGGLLDGEAFSQPEPAQQGAQFAAANRGAAHFRHVDSVLSQESNAVAQNPGPMVPTLGTMPMIRAGCTLVWHLPSCIARCTMKSDRRSHPIATRRHRGRAVTRGVADSRPRANTARTGDRKSPRETWLREEREALPFHLARPDRIRFRCAGACGPWPCIHGDNRDNPGPRQPSAARYPGHAAGPVLQHRPSETLPRLWTELEGLAM